MDTMRQKRTGSYDNERWRLKGFIDPQTGKEVSQTLLQLSERFKVRLTTKEQSKPYWKQFLADFWQRFLPASPLKVRTKSLERLIEVRRENGMMVAELENELAECKTARPDTDIADVQAYAPEALTLASKIGINPYDGDVIPGCTHSTDRSLTGE